MRITGENGNKMGKTNNFKINFCVNKLFLISFPSPLPSWMPPLITNENPRKNNIHDVILASYMFHDLIIQRAEPRKARNEPHIWLRRPAVLGPKMLLKILQLGI